MHTITQGGWHSVARRYYIVVTLYSSSLSAASQSASQMSIHGQRMAFFTISSSRETSLISTKSVPECPILVPEIPILTFELVPEPPPPPFFTLRCHIPTMMWGECPPPPQEYNCEKDIEHALTYVRKILCRRMTTSNHENVVNPFSTGTGRTLYKVYGGFRISYGTG